MRLSSLLFILVFFVSCTPKIGGVYKLGPDTYQSEASFGFAGGETAARAASLDGAKQYCREQGKEILVDSIKSAPLQGAMQGDWKIMLVFQCLDKNDSDLHQPTFRSNPDTVIEDRR